MEKKNKGFSLVELIVVIVILAILIGVTIGGIYSYVNKARRNTDIQNIKAIYDTISVLKVDPDVNNMMKIVMDETSETKHGQLVGGCWSYEKEHTSGNLYCWSADVKRINDDDYRDKNGNPNNNWIWANDGDGIYAFYVGLPFNRMGDPKYKGYNDWSIRCKFDALFPDGLPAPKEKDMTFYMGVYATGDKLDPVGVVAGMIPKKDCMNINANTYNSTIGSYIRWSNSKPWLE